MFIRIMLGIDSTAKVLEFDDNSFIKVHTVLLRVREIYGYSQSSLLQLLTDSGIPLAEDKLLGNGRTYKVCRPPNYHTRRGSTHKITLHNRNRYT